MSAIWTTDLQENPHFPQISPKLWILSKIKDCYFELLSFEAVYNAVMHACTREGNGNPLQCSCLENPRDRGAWWAAVYGVTQSRTRLSNLAAAAAAECSDG